MQADAIHADGAAVGGRGHPSVFGFYANKQLTTGEGGMVTMDSEALKTAGVGEELVRLSIGLEAASDIIDDFAQALRASQRA